MLESTTSPETRLIFQRAHEDRARVFLEAWRRLIPRLGRRVA